MGFGVGAGSGQGFGAGYGGAGTGGLGVGGAGSSVFSEKTASNATQTIIKWNETTYSGTDIKLVVHTGAGNVLATQMKLLEQQMKLAQDRLIELGATHGGFPSALKLLPGRAEEAKQLEQQFFTMAKQHAEWNKVLQGFYGAIPIATAQTLSVQTHTEKMPVRSLGFKSAKGYTKGTRTIAGSIIFTVFNEHPLARLMHDPPTQWSHEKAVQARPWVTLADQLPPLTITAVFNNEYGSMSQLTLYGVEFINDGMVMSIEDIYLENPITFVARDYDPLLSLGRLQQSENGALIANPESASSLLNSKQYADYKTRFDVRRSRFK